MAAHFISQGIFAIVCSIVFLLNSALMTHRLSRVASKNGYESSVRDKTAGGDESRVASTVGGGAGFVKTSDEALKIQETKVKLLANLVSIRLLSTTIIPLLALTLLAAGVLPVSGMVGVEYSLQLLPLIVALYCLIFFAMDMLYLTP